MQKKRRRDEPEMPSTIARSDEHARETWKKAHDSAVETYGEGGAAHRVAYAALKHSYRKVDDHWERKETKGPSDPQASQGYRDEPKETGGGRVVGTEKRYDELYEEARALDVPGRSRMDKEALAQAIHAARAKRD